MLLSDPHEVARYLRRVMRLDIEEFWAVGLRSDKRLIASECLFRGTVDACPFHARDVFRFACRVNASSLLVAHNHPSGDVRPSAQDERITKKLMGASRLMEISIDDHLILTESELFSFKGAGMIK